MLVACNYTDEQHFTSPKVSVEHKAYTLTAGHSISICPKVTSEDAFKVEWIEDGKVISDNDSITVRRNTACTVNLTFKATSRGGTTTVNISIVFTQPTPPVIDFAEAAEGFVIPQGYELSLCPSISNSPNKIVWTLDGKSVGSTQRLNITPSDGLHSLKIFATNDDGADSVECSVDVRTADAIPIRLTLPTTYTVLCDSTLTISPTIWAPTPRATYTWNVDGSIVQTAQSPVLKFSRHATGRYNLTLTASNTRYTTTLSVTVDVCPPQNTYRRAVTAESSAQFSTVTEYTPAAGQFIGDGFTVSTPQQAATFASLKLKNGLFCSLGGFGGRITFAFDHSIINDGGYNIRILGNSFPDSSEPGIVWVMQDSNGNGLPDDTAYELRGSEYGKAEVKQGYAIKYYRPSGDYRDIEWRDNTGACGLLPRNEYHAQQSYYPLWAEATLTLLGTCLPPNVVEREPNLFIAQPLTWGYADNYASKAYSNGWCLLRIADAVTTDGKPANLTHIDFVTVQSATNYIAPNIGEISTEVCGIEDYNLTK